MASPPLTHRHMGGGPLQGLTSTPHTCHKPASKYQSRSAGPKVRASTGNSGHSSAGTGPRQVRLQCLLAPTLPYKLGGPWRPPALCPHTPPPHGMDVLPLLGKTAQEFGQDAQEGVTVHFSMCPQEAKHVQVHDGTDLPQQRLRC